MVVESLGPDDPADELLPAVSELGMELELGELVLGGLRFCRSTDADPDAEPDGEVLEPAEEDDEGGVPGLIVVLS